MAEIPVERKEGGGFPWWLIPLILLLLLLPLLYYCSRNTAVVDNTNTNNRVVGLDNVNNNRNVTTINSNIPSNVPSNMAVVFNEEDSIKKANERARLAMEKVYPNGTPQQVVDALNLSIVNFATGSADIPEGNKPLLKQAAEMLKKAPSGTKVEVDGYTDNVGEPAANLKLSERRAESVRAELVKEGAPTALFTTKGYGETQPHSTNETAEGRFQNRRIEYKVATGGTSEKVTANSNTVNKQ